MKKRLTSCMNARVSEAPWAVSSWRERIVSSKYLAQKRRTYTSDAGVVTRRVAVFGKGTVAARTKTY